MQIGSVSFRPYVYNTNAVSSASMNKISAIGKDALAGKTDVSALTSQEAKNSEVMNPLKRGETLDFAGILQMQMQMSRMNADRLNLLQQEPVEAGATQKVENAGVGADAYMNSQNLAGAIGFDATV